MVCLRNNSQEFTAAEWNEGVIRVEIGDMVRGQILKGVIVIVSSFHSEVRGYWRILLREVTCSLLSFKRILLGIVLNTDYREVKMKAKDQLMGYYYNPGER